MTICCGEGEPRVFHGHVVASHAASTRLPVPYHAQSLAGVATKRH